MKKILSIIVLFSALAFTANAQPAQGKKTNHSQRVNAEMVAFLTTQLDLSVEEAENFWPVYNEIEKEQAKLRKAERDRFKALADAVKEGKPTDGLLDAYINAAKENVNLHILHTKDYAKVLSKEKLAKFYLCQERFRRMQINNLRGKGAPAHHHRDNHRTGSKASGRPALP